MVADTEDDFILGMEVIKQHGFFSILKNTVIFGKEEFVLSNKNSFRPVNIGYQNS